MQTALWPVRKFWALNAVLLGLWEAAALSTGRVPTVSAALCDARVRRPGLTLSCVVAWQVLLLRHLVRYERTATDREAT